MLIRVAQSGRPAFQLRPGEVGLSVFQTDGVEPELTEGEILSAFRKDSIAIALNPQVVHECGLQIVEVAGAPVLPERLRYTHREIRPVSGMSRSEFKLALTRLAEDVD